MKNRNFYPRQVLRALEGKTIQELDSGRLHALHYFMRKSRKMNQTIAVLSDVNRSDLEGASETAARAILENANLLIFLKLPKAA